MYDRIDQNPTIVIRVTLFLSLIYALSPKLQTAILAENSLKARVLLSSKLSEKLQNDGLVTKQPNEKWKNEKA